MPQDKAADGTGRRLMHTRTVECNGYIRDDGLWEVEARLVDTKPFTQAADHYREELKPGDPVHDIRLRLAIDDTMRIHEAEATMAETPYPTCIDVEPILQRLVGESIGKGWREVVRRKIGRLEGCTHLSELLGPAVTTLFQTMSYGKDPEGRDSMDEQRNSGERPFFIGGCYSWRTDGPIVADKFPQFATKPAPRD
ncbi:DUF2889 domain-containing protein [Bradyrhizobium sp. AUGA SZCCT0182]|uniref:DUF2889 domain-containing protein n=1 Tax=Bradyrhizobium sp. AUGA SZCCT0182 TaxID=2807667 RepID=UPI001BAC2D42|nr:DUF2889 domain-containing protein [Bradyrhizobium sp. AUGA SZCCT0182]MBR1231910.1 DUF2889 domain-containing protein [Bradyrhizobium sp. AUGA SZCCT0182]